MRNVVQLCLYSVHAWIKPRFSSSCFYSCVKIADRFQPLSLFISKKKLGDRMIKQLLKSFFWAKYRDLLATDKSRYFAQPRPIIVNYYQQLNG